ncbi:MAG TPA: hypothetical protein VM074_05300 [Solimonas sp.]|nr:hypothetical protein [Solimonas sp.]
MSSKRIAHTLAACAALGAGIAFAQPPGAGGPWQVTERSFHAPPPSVERVAMENLIAEALSVRTGRSAAEVQALLAQSPPPDVARQLGIDDASMREIFRAAHSGLIERAQAAGLIDAAQAEKLRSTPLRDSRPPGD